MIEWELIKTGLLMLGGAIAAIIVLMLVAKITSRVDVEEREGRKPIYNIEAVVKGKRTLVEADPDSGAPKTTYFVTFHKRDGNRVEMEVPGEDYGICAEGDEGILVYQGKEFIVFKRTS